MHTFWYNYWIIKNKNEGSTRTRHSIHFWRTKYSGNQCNYHCTNIILDVPPLPKKQQTNKHWNPKEFTVTAHTFARLNFYSHTFARLNFYSIMQTDTQLFNNKVRQLNSIFNILWEFLIDFLSPSFMLVLRFCDINHCKVQSIHK